MDVMTATTVFAGKVCPKAPPGAQAPVDEITGYVLWGVLSLFGLGVLICIGAIVGARVFSMPHAGKVGILGVVVIFLAAIGYLVLPGMVNGIVGDGCVNL